MEIPQHNTEEKNCIMIIANAQSSVDFSQFIRLFLILCSRKFVEFIGMFTNRYDAIISLGIPPANPVSNMNLRRSSQSLNSLAYCSHLNETIANETMPIMSIFASFYPVLLLL